MSSTTYAADTNRFAHYIQASKQVRWDIEADVIRGRQFDPSQKFLPDGLSLLPERDFLTPAEQRYVSQIQGRTSATIFGLVERFINAKGLEPSSEHWLGDQVALEALVRFSDEELKHQALFRRIEQLVGAQMPAGYTFVPQPNDVARAVLSKSTGAVLALTLDIELFTLLHYRESIDPDPQLSALFKDGFRLHWQEESQHAMMDELEWKRHDATVTPAPRDRAVNECIELVGAVDSILQVQAKADADYCAATSGRTLSKAEQQALHAGILKAYRWQYILSGAQYPPFVKVRSSLVTPAQGQRIHAALAPLQ